ncbi:erythromycin esterase family protein [Cesiribacter andamanensis]
MCGRTIPHIGDARYTDMAAGGLWNLGQLARQQLGPEQVKLVGLGAFEGSVTAGRYWGAPLEHMQLPPAREGSWEETLQQAGNSFYLLSKEIAHTNAVQQKVLHRAVGVVYNPEQERRSNYVPSRITKRYDAFLFFKNSQALHPLRQEEAESGLPDTYPWGF